MMSQNVNPTVQIPIQDYKDEWKVIPDIWETLAKLIPNSTMLTDNISPDTGKKASFIYHGTRKKNSLYDWHRHDFPHPLLAFSIYLLNNFEKFF